MRRPWVLVMAFVAPLLLGAKDPGNDLVSCTSGEDVSGPGLDIVTAKGQTIEGGQALRFIVTFSEQPPVEGPGGKAWRVDFVLRDPRKPTFSFGPYDEINRIIRYDNTDPPSAVIYLLPEQGESQPSTFILEGRNLLITVAGRQLEVDEDLEPAPLRPVRWNVISRFGRVCDQLAGGAAAFRLTRGADATLPPASPSPSATESSQPAVPTRGDPWLPLSIVAFVALLLGAFLIAKRGVIEDASSIRPSPPAPLDPPPDRPLDPPDDLP